jgi:hypothetical protein
MRFAERDTAAFSPGSEGRIKTRSLHALEIWQFISIVLSALVTGVFWGTWLGLSRSMATLTPETFLTIGHTMIGNLGTVMAILMPAAILATLPVLFLLYRRRSWALYPTLAGFALFIIALLVTLIVEVPIDNQIEAWTVASLPARGGWAYASASGAARSCGAAAHRASLCRCAVAPARRPPVIGLLLQAQ